jgi:hypothetical protein
MLHMDDTVVALIITLRDSSSAISKFPDIPSFKAGTGRQDDIGKFCLAFKPHILIYHKFQVLALMLNKDLRPRSIKDRIRSAIIENLDNFDRISSMISVRTDLFGTR